MYNSFKTPIAAVNAWFTSDMWAIARDYFTSSGSVCICWDGNNRFFIVTHPSCVAYRLRTGEFFMLLV